MKTLNKFLCTLLVIITCITSIPLQGLVGAGIDYVGLFTASAASTSDSGVCGANAKWKYDRSTKTLTIYGKGAMYDYDAYEGASTPYSDKEKYPIKNVVISEGITKIGSDAFGYAFEESDIVTVKIADSVTSIGTRAFAQSKIKELTLPKKLKNIGRYAFTGCNNLKKVVIPDSVTVVGEGAFTWCESLEELVIGNGVKELDNVFDASENLKKVTFGKSVKNFKYDLMNCGNVYCPIFVHEDNKYFSSDKNGILFNANKTKLIFYPGLLTLKSYTIPKTVTAIAEFAFYGLEKLETVNTSNVKKIGDYAFAYSSIKEVVCGNTIETMGEGAFAGCENMKTLKVPAGVIKIGSEAFSNECDVTVDKNNKKYISEDGVLFNKDKTTLIRYSANNTADTYTIPSTVTKISNFAFCSNDYLVNVTFPENLKTIGDCAFNGCDNLRSVSLSKNITSIGDTAFGYCESLKKLTIAEGSTAVIKSNAFIHCEKLNSISISSKIYKIGEDAFYGIKPVKDMEDKKQSGAYYVGSVLCGVVGAPETIKIKDGTLGIADYAFRYDNVKTVTIPASLKYIGKNAFEYTEKLTKITVDKNNKHFIMENSALLNKDKTHLYKFTSKNAKEYRAPDTLKTVDNFAFCSGAKLENIVLGSKVEKVNITMFMGTKMYEKMMGDGVVYYGKNAIEYMPGGEYSDLVILKAGTKSVSINEYTDTCFNAMYIPKSVKYIGNLPTYVYYEGTKEEWEKIEFGESVYYYIDYIRVYFNIKNDGKHTHEYYANVILPEKCFTNVTVRFTCPCGDSYTRTGDLYDNHLYSGKQYIEAATFKENGVKYEICSYCKKKFEKTTIAKIKTVKLSYTNTKYNGKVKKPQVIVEDSEGFTLYEGCDYTVKYSSGRKEVGTYTVTVTFKGDYSGTKQLKFNIVPA